jgi:hypothetical protein
MSATTIGVRGRKSWEKADFITDLIDLMRSCR